jgi:hypothetical protein
MSAFDLTQYNNINKMLAFKKNNTPSLYYDVENNLTYTTWCLSKYYTNSDQPKLYGPDFVVITYTYWHNENGYDECKQDDNECTFSPMVVIGAEYDKDIQPNWDDAASYHKYDRDSDYDMDGDYDDY